MLGARSRSASSLLLLLLARAGAWTTIQNAEFVDKMGSGFFGVVVDVRRQDEWDLGHVPNATFLKELNVNGNVEPIVGCKACNIAVYCNSGARSKVAATILEEAGFASVYDALGIVQYQNAGYELVGTPSVDPACAHESLCGDAGDGDDASKDGRILLRLLRVVLPVAALVALGLFCWQRRRTASAKGGGQA